ncbi:DUF3566 domain-containing protein [Planotetraspora sp. A-T 1434]|uniref:DUF3566 domain-containing protein n=1 Tax=Planotetraspora sp. A-T 1434 TaxID=2979219 RepID=UPI0021C1906A|nr:DUF3566 domain-containing protein [Planotetraspora sp. A-T 1434]MCT9931879.1 DUF3566 domain-containing protein [Planotetraspora sp. A-T 1434]
MSDTGRARTTGAARKKAGGARPASSSMRDGVTARVDDAGSVVEVVPDETDVTSAGKAASDKSGSDGAAADGAASDRGAADNATVRIRTSAADQPWKQSSSKDGDKPADGKVTGAEPTAPFAKPAPVTSSPAGSPGRTAAPGAGTSGRPAAAGAPGRPATAGSAGAGAGRPDPAGKPGPGAKPGPAGAPGPGVAKPATSSPPFSPPAGEAPRPASAGSAGAVSPVSRPVDGLGRGLTFGEAERTGLKTAGSKDKKHAVRAPRKAHLVLRRVEPWSAMKFSFVVSLVCFVVLFVAVAVLYGVLSALGVFTSITDAVNQLTTGGSQTGPKIDVGSWFDPVRILGYTALLGAVNVVLITALSTLGAVIYNISSDLVGGIEVTFSEAE